MENGNKTAFPSDIHRYTDGGLTKREYFAAMAMQGIVDRNFHYDDVARDSVRFADAILKELDKPKSE
jgi:hypothetical protein